MICSASAPSWTAMASVRDLANGLRAVLPLSRYPIHAGRHGDRRVLFVHKLDARAGLHPEVELAILFLEELRERIVDRVRVARHFAVGQDDAATITRDWRGVSEGLPGFLQEHIPL